jgi:hypothetical protein
MIDIVAIAVMCVIAAYGIWASFFKARNPKSEREYTDALLKRDYADIAQSRLRRFPLKHSVLQFKPKPSGKESLGEAALQRRKKALR